MQGTKSFPKRPHVTWLFHMKDRGGCLALDLTGKTPRLPQFPKI